MSTGDSIPHFDRTLSWVTLKFWATMKLARQRDDLTLHAEGKRERLDRRQSLRRRFGGAYAAPLKI
jgi:hypothetical protein